MTPQERLSRIDAELATDDQMPPLDNWGISAAALADAAALARKFRLLADADCWFATRWERMCSI